VRRHRVLDDQRRGRIHRPDAGKSASHRKRPN
jgi:superfamily II DNA or RNA helicase